MSINRMSIKYVLNTVEPDTSIYDGGQALFESSIDQCYEADSVPPSYQPLPEWPSTTHRHKYP
ncbi:hypothetical protein BDV32DRAFT_147412 [Aspergillus pseudonomiae]|uniref:Uncharacterized protein n=1 Tax=Aspergillus pseudonomiae TaxID=1506151 RepID=A0A5N7D9P6_9EURO|nr:uncharacterized protein BDV37DRAFT_284360 [Aspergillus pseudonomiae]KAB8262487.1 hypothetical protein BDV32DRAFT_147412 [Aspergillus pseudonomiae]KAE8402865.1 hypothetical protein BDV37DRAFT_284360 [Aspergillus pseudonomiae]